MANENDRFTNTTNNNRMFREQIITKEDLNEFRYLLLNELKEVLSEKPQNPKKWLRSNEVRKLLNISTGTLQTLRINGTLSFTNIGNTLYYDALEIEKILNANKSLAK
ncbi:helix-turn-helix domain-containing protein [Flavobacterium ardleyense]|uniref:Helix-turn-helix domain-containing protein n=1 Tax=Flavobacterium ardleyense TaxID=2038737 RepID=A0ABW5Z6N0_9FLAO